MKRKILYRSLEEVEIGGFDYPIEDEIFGHEYDYENDEVEHLGKRGFANLTNIDIVISTLTTMKNEGANYVSIEYHEDHGSLLMEGIEVTSIETEQLIKEEIDEIKNEIQSHENQILIHKNRISESKITIKNLKEKLK